MHDISTEARKHAIFFLACVSFLLCAFLLKECLDSYETILSVVWVFSVVLISAGTAFYVGAQIFAFLVLKGDPLLQLSTHSPLRKFLVKTLPLALGFATVGLVSVLASTTTWPKEDVTARAFAYLLAAKLVSSVAWISMAWIIGLATARLGGLYPRLFAYMGGLATMTGLQIAALWNLASLGAAQWAVGGSTGFAGYPTYCGVLGISLDVPLTLNATGPYLLGIGLNAVWIIVCLLVVVILIPYCHRRMGSRLRRR
ncbi:hypothetical protein [Actinomyces marmotae]|uniref:Uncharacterized protein n=1 Tax=Actinomyces marmotae TaxID=2737173 RepID=A0A6M8B6K8_9ACTO|nr:hypothetical protein [Actinomyces marmotae]QKD80267.1 hypothetical protein HPC72_08630 [Actinomyces marmotae]